MKKQALIIKTLRYLIKRLQYMQTDHLIELAVFVEAELIRRKLI